MRKRSNNLRDGENESNVRRFKKFKKNCMGEGPVRRMAGGEFA